MEADPEGGWRFGTSSPPMMMPWAFLDRIEEMRSRRSGDIRPATNFSEDRLLDCRWADDFGAYHVLAGIGTTGVG